MTSFLLWYLLVSLLGWLTFPLAFRLFPALSDRGFALSRAAGLLVWGFAFWLMASLGIAQNDIGGLVLALAILAGLSIWSFTTHKDEIIKFARSSSTVIIFVEVLFLIAFGFMAFVRSANPELNGTERPMELAFISAIMRSPVFPPHDPWLSGYAISYYYFGYVMTAMLAKLTGVPSSLAHNLMTSLIFGLGAIGAYGILHTLLSRTQNKEETGNTVNRPWSVAGFALLAPLFLLLVSNFGALLEVMHRYGIFWKKDESGQLTSWFWTWLNVKELNLPPTEPLGWEQAVNRYLWWWRSSRIMQDFDMRNNPLEVIDEFPFFSFLLGDLHPHVLAIPFTLLAIAVAMNIFLGGWRGQFRLLGANINIKLEGFAFSALVLGGLAFLNTWDILVGATLIVAAYVFAQAHEEGWNWHRFEDLLLFGLPLGITSILLYLPFYLGFSSQAGGILPSLMYPTRGAHLWAMWGTLLIPILGFLLYAWLGKQMPVNWKRGFSLGLGFVLTLFISMWLVAVLGYYVERDFVMGYLAGQGMDIPTFFRETSLRRLNYIGGLITMLAVLIPALSFLFHTRHEPSDETHRGSSPAIGFVMLVLTVGAVLIIAPDFVYLRDQFGYRINTIFKFYYQAWVLLSLAAAFGVAYVIQNLQHVVWNVTFRIVVGLLVFVGLLYPVLGLNTKTNGFQPYGGFTLDDFDRIERENPDEAAAIDFLRTAPDGVVAEAIGGSYDSSFARIATYTGLQNILGWPGHESQWRGGSEPQGTRQDDVLALYTTSDWETAKAILEKYDVRYVCIGNTERIFMPVSEEKFALHLRPVFQQGNVTIYEVP
jgi:YYY domain-containing protein